MYGIYIWYSPLTEGFLEVAIEIPFRRSDH